MTLTAALTERLTQHVIVPSFVSPEEADRLVAHAEAEKSGYRTHRGGDAYCTVAWIAQDHPGFAALSDRINDAVRRHNVERFRFHGLDRNFVQYQYTHYEESGDAYGWHADSSSHADYLAARRITASITLSDSSEHAGGGFELSDHRGHSNAPDAAAVYSGMQSLSDREKEMLGRKGTLILFPSDRIHRALPITSGHRRVLICWISATTQKAAS